MRSVPAHVKAVVITWELLEAVLYGNDRGYSTNLPKGVKFHEKFEDVWTRNFVVVIEHPSFPEVKEGEQIEKFPLEIIFA